MFKYKKDRIPILLFVAYFGIDLIVFFTVERVGPVFFWMLLGIFPKALICSWNHHHQHVATFKSTILNRLLELIYGFQTGVVSDAWVLHHVLGHHLNYLDQDLDESRWKRKSGARMGEIEYSLSVALTAYPRAFQVGKSFPRHQKTFLEMSSITLGLLAFFFYYNWVNALFIFVLPMMISLYITVWHTFYHHSGLDSDDEFEASYNIVEEWYNVMTGNLGYHTAHHVRPALHWSKLPQFHQKIESKIPPHLYRQSPIPIRWFAPLLTAASNGVNAVLNNQQRSP
jgi:fatty acid desaturase